MTVVSMTISGLWMRWTTPFLTGMLALTMSASTTPRLCLASPATVFDFTYARRKLCMKTKKHFQLEILI